jgi:hypothetical protein
MCSKSFLIIFLSLFLSQQLLAQTVQEPSLEELRIQVQHEGQRREQRVAEYIEKTKAARQYRDRHGNLVLLVDVTENGVPVYKTTDNAGAAITTGVDKLRLGGNQGFNLQGEGMTVAVWDGGSAKGHIELGDRIILNQGSDDTHATHVMGTILATGINASAKGMAPLAKGYAYDFNNDEDEMIFLAKPDETSILISNHSYGLITGWRFESGWQWFGDNAISAQEDYRFGFYTSNSRLWDQIAFNAPFYTICKSAGNDRSDTGSTGHPADCDGGTGYDCIGDVATAKNIITVGAVEKITSYADASSVKMSSFSSWGPTDDGRIKPDIVAAGVNLFSLSATGTNQYTSLSGTSMATPNATGSLLLLQELNQKLYGKPMKAATLKALAIHTANEAGAAPGPDYRFGWGLLNVDAAAKLLTRDDSRNVHFQERTLSEDGVIEIPIRPKANTKVTATMVWTDPAASVLPASLDPTGLMLVNDLDMRIVSGSEVHAPWILNPAESTEPATKGDNFRDNVEKVEFISTETKDYIVRINHKRSLVNLKQDVSVIITLTADGEGTTFYWLGKSSSWGNAANWSLSSGGPTAGSVPGANDIVLFDENSFKNGNTVVSLSQDVSCASLIWLAGATSSLALNDHTLTIRDDLKIGSSGVNASTTGTIRFAGNESNDSRIVTSRGNDFSKITLMFDDASYSRLTGDHNIYRIDLKEGIVDLKGLAIKLKQLIAIAPGTKELRMNNAVISNLEQSEIDMESDIQATGAEVHTSTVNPAALVWNVNFDGVFFAEAPATSLSGNSTLNKLQVSKALTLYGNNTINELEMAAGSSLLLKEGTTQTLSQATVILSTNASKANIKSTTSNAATLSFDGHYKLCFDNLNVENVDISGEGIINAGLNSTVTNSANWLQQNCNDVLFPNFVFKYNCVNSIVEFEDLSEGAIEEWSWDFGDDNPDFEIADQPDGRHLYQAAGTYSVSLTVSNASSSATYTTEILMRSNDVADNTILLSNQKLASVKSGLSYQWYKNADLLEGASQRTYDYLGEEGSYVVVISSASCNKVSSPFVISGLDENPEIETFVKVFPNPIAGEKVEVEIDEAVLPAQVSVYDHMGRLVTAQQTRETNTSILVGNLTSGIYNLVVKTKKDIVSKRIVVE